MAKEKDKGTSTMTKVKGSFLEIMKASTKDANKKTPKKGSKK